MDPKVKVLDFGKQHWSKIMGFLTIFYIFIFFAYNLSTYIFLMSKFNRIKFQLNSNFGRGQKPPSG